MRDPFFSLIVPIYKVNEIFLRYCIDSILKQTFVNWELLLVDDGSPDSCGQICDEYAEKEDRIRVIHQPNQGVSAARNNGISSAKGDWILFVDADDWIEQEALSVLYHYIEDCIYDILIFRGIREYEYESAEMRYPLKPNHIYDCTQFADKEFFYHKVMQVPNEQNGRFAPIYYSWDKVYRRSFLTENKLAYPIGLKKSEDKVFMAHCFEKVRYIFYIDSVLYHYRMNAESICHRFSADMDTQRGILAEHLKTIAFRMDNELGKMIKKDTYHEITLDCSRFLFGILSDVLLLQYFHKDNPHKYRRRKDAITFLKTEPFKSVLRNVPYKSLSGSAKLKKFLLKHNMVSLFCFLKNRGKSIRYR